MATMRDMLANNPLVRAWQEQREYKKILRAHRRRRAKAKANRDKLITKLARMTEQEKATAQARRMRDQVLNLNRVLEER